MRKLAVVIALIVAGAFFGCRSKKTTSEPPFRVSLPPLIESDAALARDASPRAARSPHTPRPAPFEGTAGIVEQKRDAASVAELREVRAASHEGFDRVVFEFDASVANYHVEYVDKPVRQCGSGDPTHIEGDGWLEIRLEPARAHDDAGRPTAAPRERFPRLSVVREVELTCDFEAVVTWVLGVGSPNRYRVLELVDPPRLAVDVLHSRR